MACHRYRICQRALASNDCTKFTALKSIEAIWSSSLRWAWVRQVKSSQLLSLLVVIKTKPQRPHTSTSQISTGLTMAISTLLKQTTCTLITHKLVSVIWRTSLSMQTSTTRWAPFKTRHTLHQQQRVRISSNNRQKSWQDKSRSNNSKEQRLRSKESTSLWMSIWAHSRAMWLDCASRGKSRMT